MSFTPRRAEALQGALVEVSVSCPTVTAPDVHVLTRRPRVLLDDKELSGRCGGGGYEAYGIDTEEGAIVVVRPDGYVGMVAPFEHLEDITGYFASFMREEQST